MGLRDFTVYDMISRNAMLYPEREAIVFGDTRLDYRAYKSACDRCAAGLVKAGIGRGDRFAVVANNSDRFLILYGAAAKIGAILVAVNWRFQVEEIRIVLEDCTPKILFAGSDFQPAAAAAAQSVKSVQAFFGMSADPGRNNFQPFDALLSDEGADAVFDIPSDAGFVIIHTAAVHGRPRGALLSQANIIAVNLQTLIGSRLDDGACYLCALPLFHISGLSTSMAVMHRAGKNVIAARFDPEQALDLIAQERVTVFSSFAPMLKMLLAKLALKSADLSSLRSLSGLEDPESIRKFMQAAFNAEFYSGFGQTEAMAVTGCNAAEKPGSAGRPSPLTRVALMDDEDREVAVGQTGEICVRSPSVFLGYWGLEAETAYTFRNGWHHTGDMGRFDAQGYLWYVKRKEEKELIKPGGENVYPAEVEKAILTHDGIHEACVIGVPDEQWREAIKAVCVLKPGAQVVPRELIAHVAAKIARFKKPKHVVFVPALPKDKEGRIDRSQVKADHGGS
jgi:acyl-CoA synthetase (AMP-forming)/AMP-acid ligase II